MPTSSALRSGVKNYARYLNVLAGTEPYVAPLVSEFDLLQTEILTGTSTDVTFSSLGTYAADYQHLQIRFTARTNRNQLNSGIFMRFNGDTGNNYTVHNLLGNGSTLTSTASTSRSTALGLPIPGGTYETASAFGAGVIDLLDPFSSSKYTTVRGLGGYSIRELQLASGLWLNTASLTSISFVTILSDSYIAGCRFSLYGLRKAA